MHSKDYLETLPISSLEIMLKLYGDSMTKEELATLKSVIAKKKFIWGIIAYTILIVAGYAAYRIFEWYVNCKSASIL